MGTPLAAFRARDPSRLTPGVPLRLVFDGVEVLQLSSGRPIELRGPVDLALYGTLMFEGVAADTGRAIRREGLSFHVVEEDGRPVDRRWNPWAARLVQQLLPDLATGAYLKTRYTITAVGAPPRTDYTVEREALG